MLLWPTCINVCWPYFFQGQKWPYLIVSFCYTWDPRFAQHPIHLLGLLKLVISKIIPDGTRDAELIIWKVYSYFGMILISISYAKSNLFQEMKRMWIAVICSFYKFGEHSDTCIVKEKQLSPSYPVL